MPPGRRASGSIGRDSDPFRNPRVQTPTTAPRIESHLTRSRRGRPGDDPIFALNAEATARRAKGESIVNATVGSLLNDDGTLAVLPTAARAVKEVPSPEWAGYAPIAGSGPFLKAVIEDVFGGRKDLAAKAVAAATPGGSGALRHAIASFLEPGHALLTTSYYWNPYATIADEQERRVETFSMFTAAGALDVGALDRALAAQVARQGRALLILNDPCQNPTRSDATRRARPSRCCSTRRTRRTVPASASPLPSRRSSRSPTARSCSSPGRPARRSPTTGSGSARSWPSSPTPRSAPTSGRRSRTRAAARGRTATAAAWRRSPAS
jgi:hypothetical protein